MYNKSEIMRNAWNIRKTANVSMSVALKSAWAVAKAEVKAEAEGKESGWNYRVHTNDWVKYGNAWNRKRETKIGYVDNLTGEFVAA